MIPPHRYSTPTGKFRIALLCAGSLFLGSLSALAQKAGKVNVIKATDFPIEGTNYYRNNQWLAINPEENKDAESRTPFPFESGTYDVVFRAVGENDGKSEYRVLLNDEQIGHFICPLSKQQFEEGAKYGVVWEKVKISKGDAIAVQAKVGSTDGEFSRGRWAGLTFVPAGQGKAELAKASSPKKSSARKKSATQPAGKIDLTKHFSDPTKRMADGNGAIEISGELQEWHKVTLTLDGPFAHELDKSPNPFTDYRMTVLFTHESGQPSYKVPGYFAADGDAANSGADKGTQWRAHLSPDKTGTWNYKVQFTKGSNVAVNDQAGEPLEKFDGKSGSFVITKTDKTAPDMRSKGRLQYVGEHYLQFAGNKEYFIKCGADAPENLFAYQDFDGTFKTDGVKDNLLKTWEPHVRDWKNGDPIWQKSKGKGLVGAINYLASEGMNAFSFLTMNINGDDRNVFPYTTYNDRLNMDVSRLAQWEIILSHGTAKGMFLHFKTMETENEMLLDHGDLGPERKLYYRELIARFAHHPALNWNLGEEINEATTEQKAAWAQYFHNTDPYQNHIVIHNMGHPHYDLLGPDFELTGFSLQTNKPDFSRVHERTLDYITRSAAAGKKWAVACDEPGDATHALITDEEDPSHRNARVNGLWGCYTAGGYGLEWYFGYKHPHSDLTCQDWRSRDLFWDQCRYALQFFEQEKLPLTEMANADHLAEGDAYVFSRKAGPYLVVLKTGGEISLDLTEAEGKLSARWFNPRTGKYTDGGSLEGGRKTTLGPPPSEPDMDWVIILK
ncbi:DUF5060 domain-containing protein [Verrucomicrobiaceae bacterium 227]